MFSRAANTATCPTCFETFCVPGPAENEVPTHWDYDCEVCCRPMFIHFELDGQRATMTSLL
ncbi:MAG: CPXCG motif-containing cysteine-rich protein [Opitutales bacterium]